MSKTPFELRFDVLRLAREHLVGEYDAAIYKNGVLSTEPGGQQKLADTQYPSFDNVLSLAGRMREFVDDVKVKSAAPKLKEFIAESEADVASGNDAESDAELEKFKEIVSKTLTAAPHPTLVKKHETQRIAPAPRVSPNIEDGEYKRRLNSVLDALFENNRLLRGVVIPKAEDRANRFYRAINDFSFTFMDEPNSIKIGFAFVAEPSPKTSVKIHRNDKEALVIHSRPYHALVIDHSFDATRYLPNLAWVVAWFEEMSAEFRHWTNRQIVENDLTEGPNQP